jgi:hypothetical protein
LAALKFKKIKERINVIAVGGDEIEECRTGVSPVALPEGTNNLDFKEDRREEQLESFQESVLGKTEGEGNGESATELADFHKFIVKKKRDED